MTDKEWDKIVFRLKEICKNLGYDESYRDRDNTGYELYYIGKDRTGDEYFEFGYRTKDSQNEMFYKSGFVAFPDYCIANKLSYKAMDTLITIMYEPEKI